MKHISIFICLLLVTLAGPFAFAASAQPNIIILLADDLGWRDLGSYGSTFHETPNLDRLAAESLRFTDAYTASTVCSPTRASIITGQTPARHGCTNHGGNVTSSNHIGLAKALRDGGYQTFFTGKWHIGNLTPDAAGFSINQEISTRGDGENDPKSTRAITNNTLAFLEKRDANKPFFAYVAYHAVHLPLKERPGLVAKYKEKLTAHPPVSSGPTGLEIEHGRDNKQIQDDPQYAAMMEGLDNSVRDILTALKTHELDSRTIVVFTSDNGGLSTKPCTSNLPLRAGKGWAYEGGIRVPLIIRWPNMIKTGAVSSVPVISMDFYPTLLQAAHLPLMPLQHVDGTSILLLLTNAEKPERDTLYWHYPHTHDAGCTPVGALREGPYKLIHWYGAKTYELYHLQNDLSELQELSAKQPDVRERLIKKLTAWQQSFPQLSYDAGGAKKVPNK